MFFLLTTPLRSFVVQAFVRRASMNRPAPPSLSREEQRELEGLLQKAQTPLAPSNNQADPTIHPDTRIPIKPEFEGEINPITGERGGPKQEPVKRWTADPGDWNFKGRVSDF